MIKVLFFARLREELGESVVEVPVEEAGTTVADLLSGLAARGDGWARALAADNLLCAVNQEQSDRSSTVRDGDEVAFYPPVTGG